MMIHFLFFKHISTQAYTTATSSCIFVQNNLMEKNYLPNCKRLHVQSITIMFYGLQLLQCLTLHPVLVGRYRSDFWFQFWVFWVTPPKETKQQAIVLVVFYKTERNVSSNKNSMAEIT